VYLWSAAFAVGALAALVSLACSSVRSARRLVVTAGGCVLGLILTRATAGWPMALALIATGVWFSLRRVDRRRRTGLALVGAGIISILVSAGVNWMKFRHPFMIPLEYQEWTQASARRRMALMMNDGSLAGTQFLPTTLVNYFRPDGIRFVPYFPFVTLPAEPGRAYGGAFVDQMYRTGSIPAFMPLLFLLSLWGLLTVFRHRAGRALSSLRIPMLGSLAVTATVMCYGYIGFRYTSEFVAVLALGSAVGLADITRRLGSRPRRVRTAAIAVMGALAAFSIYANSSVGLASARTTARGSQLVSYVSWQDRISSMAGNPLAGMTRQAGELPPSAPADELWIVGDCESLYLSTGDHYEPWVTVETRSVSVVVEASEAGVGEATLRMFDVDSHRPRQITLETNGRGGARLRVGEGIYFLPTEWQQLGDGERIEARFTADTALDRLYLEFGESTTVIALAAWNPQWNVEVTQPAVHLAPVDDQRAAGVSLTPVLGPPLELCNRLLQRVD